MELGSFSIFGEKEEGKRKLLTGLERRSSMFPRHLRSVIQICHLGNNAGRCWYS